LLFLPALDTGDSQAAVRDQDTQVRAMTM